MIANPGLISKSSHHCRLDLEAKYPLRQEPRTFFGDSGYTILKKALISDTLRLYGGIINEEVERLNTERQPLEKRDLAGKARGRSGNVTQDSEPAREINATILRLLGINHERISFRIQGLEARLVGVLPAIVIKTILN